jgi:hypothetical protein
MTAYFLSSVISQTVGIFGNRFISFLTAMIWLLRKNNDCVAFSQHVAKTHARLASEGRNILPARTGFLDPRRLKKKPDGPGKLA